MAAAEGIMSQTSNMIVKSDIDQQGQIGLQPSATEVMSQELQQEESYLNEAVLEININNVVCSYSTQCHLNLRRIALEGSNVEFKKEHGMCNMKLRNPKVTASIWSSGKITCTGSTSEEDSKKSARRIARRLQVMGFNVRFTNFRVVNVLGTCSMPFSIKITLFSKKYKEQASYEPELHPGVTYRIKEPKATLKIFSTGSITVTAPSVYNVQCAIEHIYPLVAEFKAEDVDIDKKQRLKEQKYLKSHHGMQELNKIHRSEGEEEREEIETDEDSFDSEESHD